MDNENIQLGAMIADDEQVFEGDILNLLKF
jgi:hypothetical protein